MTALAAARAYGGPSPAGASGGDQGPRTPVRIVGDGTEATIRAALTRVWRLAGQPLLLVVPPLPSPAEVIALEWVIEHRLHGNHYVTSTLTDLPPCVEVDAAQPPPWCGCKQPPCDRCHVHGAGW